MEFISSNIKAQRFFFKKKSVIVVKDSNLDQKYIPRYQPKTNMYLNISLIHKVLIAHYNILASKLADSCPSFWRPLEVINKNVIIK